MNPQSNTSSPASSANPQSEIPNPQSEGRPRALDDAKRREICALVAGGCNLRDAARYVRCSVRTIRREAERNLQFDEQLRQSETYAQLSPLRAMQHAVSTHWRAAAWFLERAFPERFAKPEAGAFGARQARRLLDEVLQIFSSEVPDSYHYERIEKRIRATFEYHVRSACDRRRNSQNLRKAMSFYENKERHDDPLAAFGFSSPDLSSLFNPKSAPTPRPKAPKPTSAPDCAPKHTQPTTIADVIRDVIDRVQSPDKSMATPQPPPQTRDRERASNGQ